MSPAKRVLRVLLVAGSVWGALVATQTSAQNLSVGDDVGTDHFAFGFHPFYFEAKRGEDAFSRHVGQGSAAGQQYSVTGYFQVQNPGTRVPVTTVAKFYHVIHDNPRWLGALLITTHGNTDILAIEPYEATRDGFLAREARYRAYTNGTTGVRNLPAFADNVDIFRINDVDNRGVEYYGIGIRARFIRAHGRMTQGLAYVGACEGGSLTDDFVAANARVAVGNSDCPTAAAQNTRVTTFFERLDGFHGQANRTVTAAVTGLNLTLDGEGNTTLAPSVTRVTAPCPIKTDDVVRFTFDTTCERSIRPDVECVAGCTIGGVAWENSSTLRAKVAAPPPPGSDTFTLRLRWWRTRSDQNHAKLDGNTRPANTNARGPAHDHYEQTFTCPDGDDQADGGEEPPPDAGEENGQTKDCRGCAGSATSAAAVLLTASLLWLPRRRRPATSNHEDDRS